MQGKIKINTVQDILHGNTYGEENRNFIDTYSNLHQSDTIMNNVTPINSVSHMLKAKPGTGKGSVFQKPSNSVGSFSKGRTGKQLFTK